MSLLFAIIALVIFRCLAELLLPVAKSRAPLIVIVSPQVTLHISALLEEKELLSRLTFSLLFYLPSSRLRLFIQELKVKVYLRLSACLYGSVNLPTPPLYYSPPSPSA